VFGRIEELLGQWAERESLPRGKVVQAGDRFR